MIVTTYEHTLARQLAEDLPGTPQFATSTAPRSSTHLHGAAPDQRARHTASPVRPSEALPYRQSTGVASEFLSPSPTLQSPAGSVCMSERHVGPGHNAGAPPSRRLACPGVVPSY